MSKPGSSHGEQPQRERRGDCHHARSPEDLARSGPVLGGADERVAGAHAARAPGGRTSSPPGVRTCRQSPEPAAVELALEAVDRRVQPGRPSYPDRAVRAPVHRHHETGLDQLGRPRGAARVEVALAERPPPSPDRQQRQVDRPERRHRVEQVGVAGEVHGLVVGVHDVPDRVRGDTAVRAATRGVHRRHGLDGQRPGRQRLAGTGLTDVGKALAAQEPAGASRHDDLDLTVEHPQ